MTYTGSGTFTLNGSAVSTYTGATTVNGGTLLLDFSNRATPNNLVSSSSSLTLGGGALSITRKTGAFASSQTLASLALTTRTSSSIVLTPNGGTSSTLTFTANTASTVGSVNFNYSACTTNRCHGGQ